ncbi:MAG: carbohydrate kinase family protein, partial [Phycisphaerales bacterium]|nr:carbohydrate kinase family protein [Phycisphaerales bacterium]
LLEPLRDCGVDLTGVIRFGNASTNNLLKYLHDGSKRIDYLSRAPQLVPRDWPPTYSEVDLIYICPMDWDVDLQSIPGFARLGRRLACDLGGFGGAHSPPTDQPQMTRDPEAIRRLISLMDIVKASDEDCRRLTGDHQLTLKDFAKQWLAWGAKLGIITMGSQGALVLTPTQSVQIPALQIEPVDATGGGDSFMGGFLLRYLQTGDPVDAGYYGAATASIVIAGTGGVTSARMPSAQTVSNRLAESQHARQVQEAH